MSIAPPRHIKVRMFAETVESILLWGNNTDTHKEGRNVLGWYIHTYAKKGTSPGENTELEMLRLNGSNGSSA